MCIRGTPDFLLCCNSVFVAIELKKDTKSKTSPLQDYTLQQITQASGVTLIATPENWKTTYELLKKIDKKGYNFLVNKGGH